MSVLKKIAMIYNVSMKLMLINIFKFCVCLMPLFLYLLFGFFLFKNKSFFDSFKKHYRKILINTLFFILIGIVAFSIFFYFEDNIYTFDFAGQWIKVLELKDIFNTSPKLIFNEIIYSINYSNYSYLPAFLELPFAMISSFDYSFFATILFVAYLLPTSLILQTLYFKYINKYKYLPLFISISFFPLYLIDLDAEVDTVCFFFVAYTIFVLFLNKIDDINYYDVVGVNIAVLMLLFTRTYFIYYVFVMYLAFLFKTLIEIKRYNLNVVKCLTKMIATGIFALAIILIFFRPYIRNTLFNDFATTYAFNNRSDKLFAFISYYGILIDIICLLGIIKMIIDKRYIILSFLLISIFVICFLFWQIQSFESHHYCIINIQMLILYSFGLVFLIDYLKKFSIVFVVLLLLQNISIFIETIPNIAIFTSQKKTPTTYYGKSYIKEFNDYLNTLDGGIYFASGDSNFNSNVVSNVNLPDLDSRLIVRDYIYDLRDGFPNFDLIDYVVITDPILYFNSDYQKIYSVITDLMFSDLAYQSFDYLEERYFGSTCVLTYKKTHPISKEINEFFYKRMSELYPEKEAEYKELFK